MRTVFAFCFLGLLSVLGGTAVWNCLTKDRSANGTTPSTAIRSFRELYPFADESNDSAVTWKQQRPFADLRQLDKGIRGQLAAVDKYTSGRSPLANFFRRAASRYDTLVGNRVVRSGSETVIRLDSGSYTYLFPYFPKASESWTNVLEFATWLKAQNIKLLHVLPPYKFDDRETVFPEGVPHGYGRMVDEYRQLLRAHGIPCLDAREIVRAENPDFASWFGKRYFHYSAHTGLTIARGMARTLRDELGLAVDLDALRAENFTRQVYPDHYQSTLADGRDPVTEDFEVYYPRTEGRFRIETPGNGRVLTGGFRETLISQHSIETFNTGYNAFFQGYVTLARAENLSCTNTTRVLVIRRCDAGVICPYLACAVRAVDSMIPYKFDGSLRMYIERTHPDVVIFCTFMQTGVQECFWKLK